jgi:hypothetical protein
VKLSQRLHPHLTFGYAPTCRVSNIWLYQPDHRSDGARTLRLSDRSENADCTAQGSFGRLLASSTNRGIASNLSEQLRGSTQRINKLKDRFWKALRIFQGLICRLQLLDPLGGTDTQEGALNTFFGRADAASLKYAFVAAFILVAIFITLLGVGLNLSNTTFDLALS